MLALICGTTFNITLWVGLDSFKKIDMRMRIIQLPARPIVLRARTYVRERERSLDGRGCYLENSTRGGSEWLRVLANGERGEAQD